MDKRRYSCPKCRETFEYQPSLRARGAIEQQELATGKPTVVMLCCIHCDANLLIDRANATAVESVMSNLDVKSMGTIVYDMEATERAEQEVRRLLDEGDHLNQRAQVHEALAKFEAALRIRKHDPQAWFYRGVCLSTLGEVPRALEAFRHATRIDPGLKQAWNNMGFALLQAGQLQEAEAAFDEGMRHNPDYPKLYLGKANCRALAGDIKGARRLLKTALEKDPNYQPAIAMLKQLG